MISGTISAAKIKLFGLMSVFSSSTATSASGYLGYASTWYGNNSGIGLKSSNLSGQIIATNAASKLMFIEPEDGYGVTQCSAVGNMLVFSAYGESGNYLNSQTYMYLTGHNGYAGFYPDNEKVDLGTSGNKWRNTYCSNGVWTGSDRNNKKDISYNIDDYLNVFDRLQPASYKFKDGQSGRTHVGFIAQDVEQAILDSGMTTTDYACISISPKAEGEGNDYSLRYEEFIALVVLKIKKLEQRIAALEGA